MSDEEDDIVLSELSDKDLGPAFNDDLYDGLTEEIVAAPIPLDRTKKMCCSAWMA
ncbi:MAG: hypothetical protein CM15mP84_00560 [Cellvibrionales bacterium]|nr:MAG: hypothetical protein CM15mP84_00560 [Cellvibrionales bacterium]